MFNVIPYHSSGLRINDYLPYLLPSFLQKKGMAFNDLWKSYFPDAAVYPQPSGRYALWHFLEHCQFEENSEVLVSAYNYYVMIRLLVQKKLRPVFVDIDPETLCMDSTDLEQKITKKTCMVLVTHMFGIPADMKKNIALCEQYNLKLFEDCAHALGSTHGDRQVGQHGDGALFSFGIAKITNSLGGGMLVLNEKLAQTYTNPQYKVSSLLSIMDTAVRFVISLVSTPQIYGVLMAPLINLSVKLAEHGHYGLRNFVSPSQNDAFYLFSTNNRAPYKEFMTAMQERQLSRLKKNIANRLRVSAEIKNRLAHTSQLRWLDENKFGIWNGSYLGVYVPDKAVFDKHLRRHSIVCNPQEFFDCSRLQQFSEFSTDCKKSTYASDHLVRIPNYGEMSETNISRIVAAIESLYKP